MYTIAIPIYKYKPEFDHVLEAIKNIGPKYVKEILCFIQPSEDVDKIIESIKKSKLNVKYEVNDYNIGMVENWNKCMKACKTKYLLINHDDDYLMPNILKKYTKIFNKYPEAAVVSCKTIYSNNSFFKKLIKRAINILPNKINYYNVNEVKRYIMNDFTLPCSGVVFNMDLLKTNFLFSNDYPYTSDEELWPRILKSHPIIVANKFLFIRNIKEGHNYEFETWHDSNFVNQYVDIRKKIIQYSDNDDDIIALFKRELVRSLRAVENGTGKKIDMDYYINSYLEEKIL